MLPAARVGDGEAFAGFGVYAGGLHPGKFRVLSFRHDDVATGDELGFICGKNAPVLGDQIGW